ncbi:MAG: ATP-binding cassette domain-containing protein [Clostridium sp.]
MFEVKNLSKKYNKEYAIRNLNLEIGCGLNFIIGSSGSGKTTLLKIMSGMESNYEGDVIYLGKSMKTLTDNEKAYYYNNKFGFVWQDFNLIEDMTVEENILLSLYLKNVNEKNEVIKVLKRLKISNLKDVKVKLLSGGQKQRVAIARELVKNPDVIIADEPTSALDSKASQEVIHILKEISKERTVIIVTHDTSLIDNNSKVYELDKGELISKPEVVNSKSKVNKIFEPRSIEFEKSISIAMTNCKSKISRSLVTCLAIMVSSVLLMTAFSGVVSKSGEDEFNKLYDKYGRSILDLSVTQSFTSASGGSNDKPKGDVEQNINGLYEKYINDNRIEHMVFSQAIDNINIEVEQKKYSIEGSGSVPTLNEIIKGNFPKNNGEVIVPEDFVKKMGLNNDDAIGKEIDFSGTVYNWDSGKPQERKINVKAKIVGIADTKVKSEYNGIISEYEVNDSFFFDKDTLNEINKQSGSSKSEHNFVLRAKDPQSLIEIKNEITKKGVVPLGTFELVEDIVKLNSQTAELSKGSTVIIVALSIIGLTVILIITSIMRKREYAIYKVCGYSNSQLSSVLLGESVFLGVISAGLVVVLSPITSILTKMSFGSAITDMKILMLGALISIILSGLLFVIAKGVAKKSQVMMVLKSGGR